MEIDAKTAVQRMKKGDVIYRQIRDGVVTWWFETPYAVVVEEAGFTPGVKVGKRYQMVAAGDGLFGAESSQTWKAVQLKRGAVT